MLSVTAISIHPLLSSIIDHKRMPRSILLLLLLALSTPVLSLYSPYYRRCRLHSTAVDADAVPIEQIEIERVPSYFSSFYIEPITRGELEIDYEDFKYYYHEYIDSGGSGEVYLVEDQQTETGKVLKRFFRERPSEFKRENFIMKRLGYDIRWAKDCNGTCLPGAEVFNTMAIFPYKESIVLRKLEFDGQQAPLIFYKILQALNNIHKLGIVHHDIKMGNIMVNSMGPNFKFYEVQLIDWNIARFYHKGFENSGKRGTNCYYSPQQLLRTFHITPAVDIWALAIVMFTYYTDAKPFVINCKTDNLMAIISLVGGQKIVDLYKKYNLYSLEYSKLMPELQAHPQKFPAFNLSTFKTKINKEYFTEDFVEVMKRMLEPDPEERATIEELLQMKYFQKISVLPEMYYYKNKHDKSKKDSKTKVSKVSKGSENSKPAEEK